MRKRILVNREECEVRVAFVEDDNLVELHTEKFQERHIVNNIYRGRVQDVVPGLQAAFVDVGLERNVFLHFMDIRPESLVLDKDDPREALREASKKQLPGRIERRGRRPRQDPSASQAAPPVKRGDNIIVQVVKDEISGKAPRVTTNLSLPGRYLVLLPFPSQEGGVSRKIALGQNRYRLKKLLASIKDEDHSYIVRTAGVDQPEEAIQQDAQHLCDLWDAIIEAYRKREKPGLIYNDHDLLVRMVRDAFPPDFSEVVCDHPDDSEIVKQQLSRLMPENAERVRVYKGVENIFDNFGVESQLEGALARKVPLKSGGSLIIDENEALTAIDVNTGRFTGRKDQEKTSLKTNMEACEVIAQQIRLRDIGGIIVIDFIDMLSKTHQDKVSEELRRALKHDRAKTAVGRIGDFGLMMLTRKRVRMSMQNQVFDGCPYCSGTGLVLTEDEAFRRLKYDLRKLLTAKKRPKCVVVSVHPKFLEHLGARFGKFLEKLKYGTNVDLLFRGDSDFHLEEYQLTPLEDPARGSLRISTQHIEIEGRSETVHRYHKEREGADEHIDSSPYSAASLPQSEGQVLTLEQVSAEPSSLKDEEDSSDKYADSASSGISGVVTPESVPLPELKKSSDRDDDQDDGDGGGRKKRRRRESSSERRARRRRAKQQRIAEERDGQQQGDGQQDDQREDKQQDKAPQRDGAQEEMKTAEKPTEQPAAQQGRRQRKPRPPRKDEPSPPQQKQSAPPRREEPKTQEQPNPEATEAKPAEPAKSDAPPKEEEKKSGRRGRGRRGGRGRRSEDKGEAKPVEASEQKAPPAEEKPKPAPAEDLMAQVEAAIKDIDSPKAAEKPSPAEEETPKKRTTRGRRKPAAKKAAEAEAAPEKKESPAPEKKVESEAKEPAKKTTRPRRTTRAKKTTKAVESPAKDESKSKDAGEEKKPARRTRRTTTRSRAKKAEESPKEDKKS